MPAIKVLMADDEEAILEIMARKIAGAGYDVVTAADGEEAWAKIKKENPDIIVLDLNMPKMGGWDVLRELRTNPPTSKWQPVIIVSAQDEMFQMEQGFKLQADHYLTKPCRIEDIIKTIRLMVSIIPLRNT